MAQALGISPAYVNMLEHNQRSLSVALLMSLSETYAVDWRDLIKDEDSNLLADLRNALKDPVFDGQMPDLQELRGAIDHAPQLVRQFLKLYRNHRGTYDRILRLERLGQIEDLSRATPEATVHDLFRENSNYFASIEASAEAIRRKNPCTPDDIYAMLKQRLKDKHGLSVEILAIEEMKETLRRHEPENARITLSEALDHQNRVFQLAHVLCLLECPETLEAVTKSKKGLSEQSRTRCHVELANYFASALLMPYASFQAAAEETSYDVDRLSARFGVSFEQVCHRLTTLQREGAKGIPFFFLRVDKAGNVTKRFNASSFNLAEHGGACPVWNIHTAFRTPGLILPQFVELPEGDRYFTISRTADRPVFSMDTQDRRVAITLGCELSYADRLVYTAPFNLSDPELFSPIGINCHICARKACSQRAHQPLFMELDIKADQRGTTRYES